jgi:hypothetical protein
MSPTAKPAKMMAKSGMRLTVKRVFHSENYIFAISLCGSWHIKCHKPGFGGQTLRLKAAKNFQVLPLSECDSM